MPFDAYRDEQQEQRTELDQVYMHLLLSSCISIKKLTMQCASLY